MTDDIRSDLASEPPFGHDANTIRLTVKCERGRSIDPSAVLKEALQTAIAGLGDGRYRFNDHSGVFYRGNDRGFRAVVDIWLPSTISVERIDAWREGDLR